MTAISMASWRVRCLARRNANFYGSNDGLRHGQREKFHSRLLIPSYIVISHLGRVVLYQILFIIWIYNWISATRARLDAEKRIDMGGIQQAQIGLWFGPFVIISRLSWLASIRIRGSSLQHLLRGRIFEKTQFWPLDGVGE